MSNEVQVTVVTGAEETTIYHKQGERLLDTLVSRGGYALASCGGRGTCGQCRVQFLSGIPLPSHADRAFFTPEQLRKGYRLACTAKPVTDCKLRICFLEQPKLEVALDTVNETEQMEAGSGLQQMQKPDCGCNRAESDRGARCFIAVDLGTTTIAMRLVSLVTGEKLATYVVVNPQRSYGTDVISRITASNQGMRDELRRLTRDALEKGIDNLVKKIEGQLLPEYIIISGNTTMGHLLMGYDTSLLGVYPFTPVNTGWIHTSLHNIPTLLIPGISAFVGGDIVAGIYACGMTEKEAVSLLIDLGTNGEMAIGNQDRILCTATAAGPAFEGGITTGIFGADIIKITADMIRKSVIDETGLLADAYFESGYEIKNLAQTAQSVLRISQQDIRALQVAKAAVYAGVHILTQQYGISFDQIGHVYLAGGFGLKLNVEDAVRIGLLPEKLQNKITIVSNTSLRGACLYGMQRGSDEKAQKNAKETLEHILEVAKEIHLARQPEFENIYVENLNFPVR